MEAIGHTAALAARESEDLDQIAALLTARGGGLFNAFSPEVLPEVCGRLEYRSVPAGSVLFREGAEASELFVVAAGRLRIIRGDLGDLACEEESSSQADGYIDAGDELTGFDDLAEDVVSSAADSPTGGDLGATGGKQGAHRLHLAAPAALSPISSRGSRYNRASGLAGLGISASSSIATMEASAMRGMASKSSVVMTEEPLFTASRLECPVADLLKTFARAGLATLPDKGIVQYRDAMMSFNDRVDEALSARGLGPLAAARQAQQATQQQPPQAQKTGHKHHKAPKTPQAPAQAPLQQPQPQKSETPQPAATRHLSGEENSVMSAPQGDDGVNRVFKKRSSGVGMGRQRSGREVFSNMQKNCSSDGNEYTAMMSVGALGAEMSSMSQTRQLLYAACEANSNALVRSSEALVGHTVGALACLSRRPHTWSAVTSEPCELLVLSARSLGALVELERRSSRTERERALRGASGALGAIDREKLVRLVECFRSTRHRRGAILCEHGDLRAPPGSDGDRLQIIAAGHTRVLGVVPVCDGGDGKAGSRGLAGGTMRQLGTLMPGQVVNGTSQLLGLPENFTIICESAEVEVISAPLSQLTRIAGQGVLDGLRSAIEDLNAFLEGRLALPEVGREARVDGAGHRTQFGSGYVVPAMPGDFLHSHHASGVLRRGADLYPKPPRRIPPPITPPKTAGSLSPTGERPRRGVVAAAGACVGGERQRSRRPRPACSSSRGGGSSAPDYPAPAEADVFDEGRSLSTCSGVLAASGSHSARRRPSISDALLWMTTPSQFQSSASITGSLLVDATLRPDDFATTSRLTSGPTLGSHGSLLEDWRLAGATPPQFVARATAQLRRCEDHALAVTDAGLQRVEVRGENATLLPMRAIDPPCIFALAPSRASDTSGQRRLLGTSGPLAATLTPVSLELAGEQPASDVAAPQTPTPPQVAQTAPPLVDTGRDLAVLASTLPPAPLTPLVPEAVVSPGRSRTARNVARMRQPEPLTENQLDSLDQALELVQAFQSGSRTNLAEDGGLVAGPLDAGTSTISTATLDEELAVPSTLVDDFSVWEHVASVMTAASADTGHSSGYLPLRHRQVHAGTAGAGPRAALSTGPSPPPLPVPLPPLRPPPPRRALAERRAAQAAEAAMGTSWRRLQPVDGSAKAGRRQLEFSAPLHVHSIERFLEKPLLPSAHSARIPLRRPPPQVVVGGAGADVGASEGGAD